MSDKVEYFYFSRIPTISIIQYFIEVTVRLFDIICFDEEKNNDYNILTNKKCTIHFYEIECKS